MTTYQISVSDQIQVSDDPAAGKLICGNPVADAFAVADVAEGIAVISLAVPAETLSVNDTPSASAILSDVLAEVLALDDTAALLRFVVVTVGEDLQLADLPGTKAILRGSVTETLSFAAVLGVAGQEFVCWTANVDTFAHTRYDNYDFNSMGRMGRSYYGCADDGIYLLEGDDDAGDPIDWFLSTPHATVESGHSSRVPKFFIGFKDNCDVYLRTIVDDRDQRTYLFRRRNADKGGYGGTLGLGVKGYVWGFDLVSVTGDFVDLSTIEFFPIVLHRRIPK